MYRYCNDAEKVRELTAGRKVFARALSGVREKSAFWQKRFEDDPSRLSGWGHEFVCPACASQMKMEYRYAPNGEYVCPHCGARASGRKLDEAWVQWYRCEAARDLLASAAAYRYAGDLAARDYVVRFVDFYAANYGAFAVHGEWCGKGKIGAQSLDEAVWALDTLRALNALGKENLPAGRLERWYRELYRPLTELIAPQAQDIHNISLWIQCAVGAAALFFEDDALLQRALEGEFGVRAQVEKGYTRDGVWHEGSLHYHYYATQALTEFLAFFREKREKDELFDCLRRAYQAPAQLSADGWNVPSINDGWYPMDIGAYCEQILSAHRIAPTACTAGQLRAVYARAPERLETAAALAFYEEAGLEQKDAPRPDVCLFPATCLAVMNRPMHVLLKCGSLTDSHIHQDGLSIVLAPFSEDLGTPGYGHPLTRVYYDSALCHNTFLMDGRTQPRRALFGRVESIPDGVRGEADGIYDGVRASRTLTREGNTLRDELRIEAKGAHTFDWALHLDGKVTLPQGGLPDSLRGCDPCYDQLRQVRRYPDAKAFEARCEKGGRTLSVRIAPDTLEKATVYTAQTPGNPADQARTTILLRLSGQSARVQASYEA